MEHVEDYALFASQAVANIGNAIVGVVVSDDTRRSPQSPGRLERRLDTEYRCRKPFTADCSQRIRIKR